MKEFNVERRKRIVFKHGGASLADHERVLKAVTTVAKEARKGTQIAVMVSAMGKTTALGGVKFIALGRNTIRGAAGCGVLNAAYLKVKKYI